MPDSVTRLYNAALACRHDKRCSRGGSLADFHKGDVRQASNADQLHLQLVFVQIPQALGQAAEIAPLNPVESGVDRVDVATVVEIKLNGGQRQGDGRAE